MFICSFLINSQLLPFGDLTLWFRSQILWHPFAMWPINRHTPEVKVHLLQRSLTFSDGLFKIPAIHYLMIIGSMTKGFILTLKVRTCNLLRM